MESKENVLERFMRDQEHKANSLYDSGYRAGFEAGHDVGYVEGFNEGYKKGYEAGMASVYEELEQEERMQKAIDESVIHVGDEVIDPNGLRAIVTNTDTHHHLFYPENGKTWKAPKSIKLKKTGAEFTL